MLIRYKEQEINIILMENLRIPGPQILSQPSCDFNTDKVLDSRTLFVRDANQKKIKNKLKKQFMRYYSHTLPQCLNGEFL